MQLILLKGRSKSLPTFLGTTYFLQELHEAETFSLLIDETTYVWVLNQLIVYIRYVYKKRLVEKLQKLHVCK